MKSALALATCALAVSCSAGSTPTVRESTLEKTVYDRMTDYAGQSPDRVDCPGGLEGEKGKIQRCTLYAGGDQVGVTVTVTSVDGTDVKFEIEADDEVTQQ
jgi:hypothetical protein